ncbi:hypothetical protein BJF85_16945 [Saccharomonospora sp. CUA-673]|uniref:ESX secretion-associated protein EspG n=1 Tax=Saccharomonospora sp. CUA-673 TaxID=1904969 RepID=UPI0009602A1C|nr:ESX secretion-associated protein EspG [Saccharomonospora sp. CUA-673]OLT46521.1 hypothetical protein BJF85_16945 [Saccharomonospora sp. CUA-673]
MTRLFDKPVLLPREVLIRAWELADVGPPHPLLDESNMYVPQADRAEATRRVLQELEQRGLAKGELLTPEFRTALHVLSTPSRELYCWSTDVHDAARDHRLGLAVSGGDGVGMHIRGETAALASFDDRRLVNEFVAELPEYPIASVPELHVPRGDFDERGADHHMFASRAGVPQQLDALLSAPRERIHQVYVGGTVDDVHRRSKPFSIVDVEGRGRVVAYADGAATIHCLPGAPGNLARAFDATWRAMS